MTISGPEATNKEVKMRLSILDPECIYPKKHRLCMKNKDLPEETAQPSSMEPPMTNEKRRWTEDEIESQLPRTAFDFHKPAHGYADDDDVIAHFPCRILSDWHLCSKSTAYSRSNFPRKRTALPRHINHLDNYVLYGTIKPNHPQQEPLKVELTDLVHYTIDHSREFRGYWVATPEANYWLQQPCKKRLVLDTCTITVGMTHKGMRGEFPRYQIELPSQQDLHVFHRAQLGLFSNLVDLMFPPIAAASANTIVAGDDEDSRDFYVHYFSKRTPQEIFDELSPSPGLMKFYQEKTKRHDPSEPLTPLHEHPFDLSLLSSPCSMEFLYPHIRHLHTIHFHESTFLKALEGTVKPIDNEYDHESKSPGYFLNTGSEVTYWRQSAEEAERRSQQTPWGQPIPGSQQPPNLVSPMELSLEYRVSKLGAPDTSTDTERKVYSDTTLLSTTVLSNQLASNVKSGEPTQWEGDDLDMQPILSDPSSKRQRVERRDSLLGDSRCESDFNERRQRPKTTHSHEKAAFNNVVSTDVSKGEEDEDELQDPESAHAVDRHIMEVSEKNNHSAARIPRKKASSPVEQQFPEKTQPSSEPTLALPRALAKPVLEMIEPVAKPQVTDEPHNPLGSDKGFPSQNFELHKDRFHETPVERQPFARVVSEMETLQPHQQDRKSPTSIYEERTGSGLEKRDHDDDASDFQRPTVNANRSNDYEERRRQPSSNNSERPRRDSGHRQYLHRQREEMEYSAAAHGDPSRSKRTRESESGSYTQSLDYEKGNTPNPAHQPQSHVGGSDKRQPRRPSTHRDEFCSRNHSLEPPSSIQRHQQNPGPASGFKIEPIPGNEIEFGPDRGYHPRFDSERRPRLPMSRHISDYNENFEHPPKQVEWNPSRHISDRHEDFEEPLRRRTELPHLPHRNEEGFRDRQRPTSSYQSLDRGRRDSWHQCDTRGDFEPRIFEPRNGSNHPLPSGRQFARKPSFPQRDDSRGIAKKLVTDMISSIETRVEGKVSVEHHHPNTRRQSDRQTIPFPRDSRPAAFNYLNGGSWDPRGAHEQGHRPTINASDTRSHRPYDNHGGSRGRQQYDRAAAPDEFSQQDFGRNCRRNSEPNDGRMGVHEAPTPDRFDLKNTGLTRKNEGRGYRLADR